MNRFHQQLKYEEEGAAAANEGKRRQDCPYAKDDGDAFIFWVYGNENQQGALVTEYMRQMGTRPIYFTTCDLGPEETKAMTEWREAYQKAETELRKEKGWKP